MKLTILTLTKAERLLYMSRLVDSVAMCPRPADLEMDHMVAYGPESIGSKYKTWRNSIQGDWLWNLDEDAIIRSPDALAHVTELIGLLGDCVFSPYPVGLIGHPGGSASIGHTTRYSQRLDTYYTLRKVRSVGGFARICPTKFIRELEFGDTNNEEHHLSDYCIKHGIPQYYCENALIVEHQETYYGQRLRYPGLTKQ